MIDKSGIGEDLTIVIRTCGERTAGLCEALARAEAPQAHVEVIAEVPFSRAVKKGFEIGCREARKWTYCLDADVLLAPGRLSQLLQDANSYGEELMCLEGRIADKLLGQIRFAGNHLYSTAWAARALEDAAFDPDAIRPERHVKEQLMARGGVHTVSDVVVGLHDFHQSYADVFRKACVHAQKFREPLEAYGYGYWMEAKGNDPDFAIALAAAQLMHLSEQSARIDKRAYPDDVSFLLGFLRLEDKPALGTIDVESELVTFQPAPGFIQWKRFSALYDKGIFGRVQAMLYRYGFFGSAGQILSEKFQRDRRASYNMVKVLKT